MPRASRTRAHTPKPCAQDWTAMQAGSAAVTAPVPTTSGALREPHTVLRMSVMGSVLFHLWFYIRGITLIV